MGSFKKTAMTSDMDLETQPECCRQRQRRLVDYMHGQKLDWCILTTIEHIQYFVGPRFHWTFRPIAAINTEGNVVLVAPERRLPAVHAADELVPYEAQWLSTLRNDQALEVARKLEAARPEIRSARRVGIERSALNGHVTLPERAELVDIDVEVLRQRRRKDPDELARIRKAIAGTERMYQLARSIVRPGVNELQVFNDLQSAAVIEFGEMLTGTGNDYQCASRGGPPRDRACRAGDLYILDLGPAYRGYFADNARTIAVSEVSDLQQTAWEFIARAFAHIESVVVPGKSCRELYAEVKGILAECPCGAFDHHLGHGIGLFPHEAPHLNPNWDDTFEVGDVFTAEPGLYAPELRAGIRIENDYIVTENGIDNLTPFPLELTIND
jgi:Xaa-Pro aminopeptidase